MGKDFRLPAIIMMATLVTAATTGASASRDADDSATVSWQAVTSQIEASNAEDHRITAAIASWRALRANGLSDFSTYSSFLIANPGWPDETALRTAAESKIDPDRDSASEIAAFFAKFPPRTARGKAVHAITLSRLNRFDEAKIAARDAWTAGPLPIEMEQRLLGLFASSFTPADHLRHVDAVLWRRNTDAAERMLGYVPVTRQSIVAARIAFQRKSADATEKMGAADPIGVMDAGYIADKARWLSDSGNDQVARQLLGDRMPLAQTPAEPEKWYEVMLAQAKSAAKDQQWSLAYAIASKVDDAYAPGTDISGLSLGERDDYTSLTWLAGSAAFNKLNRPAEAEGMFVRYANGGQAPATKAKGFYWAGRAAVAARRQAEAQDYFSRAGAYPDQYYGQLALERLGRQIPAPGADGATVQLTSADRTAFSKRPVVRAAQLLGQQGAWLDQTRFVRAIAGQAETATDHELVGELSRTLGRPDLGVIAGRRATASGLSGYDRSSFPRMKVPDSEQANWTMIHAIARQESQFDRAIVSYAGAKGLMQLMPATAQEQAGKVGLAYNSGSLFDPDYNIMLGSSYFRRLMSYYNGSYPLAVAAYNAGMGNVNKWLKANGDPRLAGGDIVQWIEDIPIYQTKDYVQRVLENAVVYDLVNPMNSSPSAAPVATPLSRYLGKPSAG
jgi:soluble lytic murein transglycosylase